MILKFIEDMKRFSVFLSKLKMALFFLVELIVIIYFSSS